MNTTDAGEYLIVNQGSIRLARFIEKGKTRIRVGWANSRRTMVRDVNVVYTLVGWLEAPNTRVIPLDDTLRPYVDKRLSAVAAELLRLGIAQLEGTRG